MYGNLLLLFLNEALRNSTHTINGKIKNAITRETNKIDKKGQAVYKNTKNIGYVFLSNNNNPIKIPADDRRFTGIE